MPSNLMTVSGSVPSMARRATLSQKSKKSTRRSSTLPAETVDYLKAWMMSPEHIAHPYPTEQEKVQIMADTGIELKQLTNWFVNNRKRFWKPRVEARLQQQARLAATAVVSKVATPTKIATQSPSIGTPYVALDMTQPSRKTPVTPDRQDAVPNNCSTKVVNSSFVSLDRSRSPRAVSIGSSSQCSVSDESTLSNEMDDDFANEDIVDEVDSDSKTITRTETLDVHILRPTGDDPIPTIEDVTILTNVPSDRIMKTFGSCTLSYRLPLDGLVDRKKAQSRRDSEIVKMKKQYLKQFVVETAATAGFSGTDGEPQAERATKKRSRFNVVEEDDDCETQRPKYLRKCTDLWRDACRAANDMYDRELPSLEEASHLFGYSAV